jgi:hypothetical protein
MNRDDRRTLRKHFGPNWVRDIGLLHEDCRIEMLLQPRLGSPSYGEWIHPGEFFLREAARDEQQTQTAEEVERIGQMREIQSKIRGRVSSGHLITPHDWVDILAGFGADWPSRVVDLMIASDTLDQGFIPPNSRGP